MYIGGGEEVPSREGRRKSIQRRLSVCSPKIAHMVRCLMYDLENIG